MAAIERFSLSFTARLLLDKNHIKEKKIKFGCLFGNNAKIMQWKDLDII